MQISGRFYALYNTHKYSHNTDREIVQPQKQMKRRWSDNDFCFATSFYDLKMAVVHLKHFCMQLVMYCLQSSAEDDVLIWSINVVKAIKVYCNDGT